MQLWTNLRVDLVPTNTHIYIDLCFDAMLQGHSHWAPPYNVPGSEIGKDMATIGVLWGSKHLTQYTCCKMILGICVFFMRRSNVSLLRFFSLIFSNSTSISWIRVLSIKVTPKSHHQMRFKTGTFYVSKVTDEKHVRAVNAAHQDNPTVLQALLIFS